MTTKKPSAPAEPPTGSKFRHNTATEGGFKVFVHRKRDDQMPPKFPKGASFIDGCRKPAE